MPIDGILFPSVQAGGSDLNVVLFHKASRCIEIELPKGTEIKASTGEEYAEGWEREYTVIEWVPRNNPEPKAVATFPMGLPFAEPFDWDTAHNKDFRDPALCIVPESIKVQVVESVQFGTTVYPVTRHRWSKGDAVF